MSDSEAVSTVVDTETADAVVETDAGIDASAEVAALKAQLAEERRRNEFLTEGFVQAKRPAWRQEAERLHPELLALVGREGFDAIQATSRRAFLREAERLAEVHAPSVTALRRSKKSVGRRSNSRVRRFKRRGGGRPRTRSAGRRYRPRMNARPRLGSWSTDERL
jgi:hypothetical protein